MKCSPLVSLHSRFVKADVKMVKTDRVRSAVPGTKLPGERSWRRSLRKAAVREDNVAALSERLVRGNSTAEVL